MMFKGEVVAKAERREVIFSGFSLGRLLAKSGAIGWSIRDITHHNVITNTRR